MHFQSIFVKYLQKKILSLKIIRKISCVDLLSTKNKHIMYKHLVYKRLLYEAMYVKVSYNLVLKRFWGPKGWEQKIFSGLGGAT